VKERPAPAERYAFGDFVLERAHERVLHRDGSALNLSPRLFSALLLFVERAGELIDKDTLILALWPGLVVDENNLSQVVSALRRELGDDAHESRYIQTVPRRGFRFVADVVALAVEPPRHDAGSAPKTTPVSPAVAPPTAELPAPPLTVPAPTASATGWPRRRWLQAAGVTTAGAAAGVTAWWYVAGPGADASRPSTATLAVLPFKPLVAEGRDECSNSAWPTA
jgi:DNA-binding winged helix-turn-helix (wHTH) protein